MKNRKNTTSGRNGHHRLLGSTPYDFTSRVETAPLLDMKGFDAVAIKRLAEQRAAMKKREDEDRELFRHSLGLGRKIGEEFFQIVDLDEAMLLSAVVNHDEGCECPQCHAEAIEEAHAIWERVQQSLPADHEYYQHSAIDEDDLFNGFVHGVASRYSACGPMIEALAQKIIDAESEAAVTN